MKLLTFSKHDPHGPSMRIGVLVEELAQVVDLQTAGRLLGGQTRNHFSNMLAFLEAGELARDDAATLVQETIQKQPPDALHSLADITIHAPVPRPCSIRDCMSFEKHLTQCTRTVLKWRSRRLAALDAWLEKRRGRGFLGPPKVWYERPIYYKGNPRSVVGHDADVMWPGYTEKLDYELEFGIFIGKQGKNIAAKEARQHIAGYTIFNDFSARDIQFREMGGRLGPAKGKDFDTGNSIGPYLVTADEIPDPYKLTMVARVNGEEWSRGTTADMHFKFEETIAYISQDETLYPGDFIGSGTVPGGCGLELDRWLAPGDVIELEIEGLGILRNRVVRPGQ